MKRKSLGNGAYVDEHGGYWVRPWINKRRTWRKLEATKEREAIKEANQQEFQANSNFRTLSEDYVKHGCPNRRLEARSKDFIQVEKSRIVFLNDFFGRFTSEEIRIKHCLAYKDWRIRKIKKGTGERTVDTDLNTLSNILNYAVCIGILEFNFIRAGRPKFRKEADVRHCRTCAPKDGEELNKLADHLFAQPSSEVLAWQLLFSAMTGCRTSELLRLRFDAKDENDPGFVSGNYLFLGRRSKNGVNPYALVTPELADLLPCFLHWHLQRYPNNPYFFPGRTLLTVEQTDAVRKLCDSGVSTRQVAKEFCISQSHVCDILRGKSSGTDALQSCDDRALAHALRRACTALQLPHRTPHAMRSFYVTKRRSDGASDAQIAAEIGDKTVELIQRTYGDCPKNWIGGEKLDWLPKEGQPAWRKWSPPQGTGGLKVDYGTLGGFSNLHESLEKWCARRDSNARPSA